MRISEIALGISPSSTLAMTAKANELKAEGQDVIGFGAGEPDLDTPNYIKDAAIKAINEGFTKYTPVSGTMELKKAISKKFKEDNNIDYKPEQIVVNNGAKHSLTNAFAAILNPGDEVIIGAPYWLSYKQMVKLAHGEPVFVNTKRQNSYKMTPEDFKSAITDKTKGVIINSPSNPTGVVYTKKELLALGKVAIENDIYMISDEIYEYLVYDDNQHISMASLGEEYYNNTITINGVSKSYAMTGWRIGYVAAPLNVAKAINNIQSHATSNPNSIAQKAAFAALTGGKEFVDRMRDTYSERRNHMYDKLIKIPGFDVIRPEGAFYCFVNISDLFGKKYGNKEVKSGQDLAELLLEEESVVVIPCQDFGTPECIRLSYAVSTADIEKGLSRIERFINKLED